MKLKLKLVRGGEILFEIPLSPADWPKKQLKSELKAFEDEFHRFSKVFNALAHETRLKMMKRLMEEEDRTMNFAGFMRELDLNPKIVWENTRKLREGGLLERIDRGKYRCSEVGQRGFMLMNFVLRHLLEIFEEMENY